MIGSGEQRSHCCKVLFDNPSRKEAGSACEDKKNILLQFCDYAWSLPDKFMRGEGLEAKSTSG